jgi:uncharacterized protein with LGFP repeats
MPPIRRGRAMKRLIITLASVASAAVVLAGLSILPAPEAASAADLSQFDAGNIISDEVFFDSGSLQQSEIQAFLAAKVPRCDPGYTCLPTWSGPSTTRSADSQCNRYTGAANESASAMIYKVAQACGINPKVLIVLLQKEQGLVTDTWPSARQWRSATGYGCPDTADCDVSYYGFFNQLYMAAWQFKRYGVNSGGYRYRANQWNTIQWHPTTSCGSSSVWVANQATANLYNYTPYQPNRAALAAGYGAGDGCSAYGNRNFFNYFTDWFGPTTYDVPGDIGTFWRSSGGSSSEVGSPVGKAGRYEVNGGGWAQEFSKGWIYFSPNGTAGLRKSSALFQSYAQSGSQYGPLGWPRGSEQCTTDGCSVQFQSGALGWTPANGVRQVTGQYSVVWNYLGGDQGVLGLPTTDLLNFTTANGPGSAQGFVGGYVYSYNGQYQYLRKNSAIFAAYEKAGSQYGSLGWPISSETCTSTTCAVEFQNGVLGWTSKTGVTTLAPELLAAWRAQGGIPQLGAPLASATVDAARVSQPTSAGTLYSVGGQGFLLRNGSAITGSFTAAGGPTGSFGWPTAGETCGTNKCWTPFERGVIGWTDRSGVNSVTGAFATAYDQAGGPTGILGLPITASLPYTVSGGGSAQDFEYGYVYGTPTTTAVGLRKNSGIFQYYGSTGSQYGSLGWPTSVEQCPTTSLCWTEFQRGTVTWTPSAGVRSVGGAELAAYQAAGGPAGRIGAATGAPVYYNAGAGGTAQNFERGYIYTSQGSSTALATSSAIFQRYASMGSQYSSLGWPRSAETCTATTCSVEFDRGTITATLATGGTQVTTR